MQKFNCGVYQIVSPSDKMYIGSSVDITRRLRTHKRTLRTGTHHCVALQRAYDKYGEDGLQFKTLFVCEPKYRIEYEQLCLDRFRQWLYNSSMTAVIGPTTGHKCSIETRAKMSASHKGLIRSPEHCANISAGRKGIKTGPFSPEARANMSAASKGRKFSAETRAKISASEKLSKARGGRCAEI
jgi:group I intron endonuclease